MEKTRQEQLIAHIARVEGQLKAVRAALADDDCNKAAKTLLAATRSLSSARAACVSCFLAEKVYKGSKVTNPDLLVDVEALLKA